MELSIKALNFDISNGALDTKELPKRIKILSWGENQTTDAPIYLNDETLKSFQAYQDKTGRDKDVAVDFDHCLVEGSKEYVAGKPKAIAAYGQPELIENDGLYLNDLDWTPLGEENARNYKDLSPVVMTDKDGNVLGLHSIGLVPNGAVKGLTFYSATSFEDIIKKTDKNEKPLAANYEKIGLVQAHEALEEDVDLNSADEDEEDKKKKNLKISADKADTNQIKTMNAKIPDAYKAQPEQYNTMNDSIIKEMASEVGLEGDSDTQKVLFAFLAKYKQNKEDSKLINRKDNTEDGGLKQFSADFVSLKAEVEQLKIDKKEQEVRFTQSERENLINKAQKEGKILPLSADTIKTIDINVLREVVENQPKNTVPTSSRLKAFSAGEIAKPKLTRDEICARMHAQIA